MILPCSRRESSPSGDLSGLEGDPPRALERADSSAEETVREGSLSEDVVFSCWARLGACATGVEGSASVASEASVIPLCLCCGKRPSRQPLRPEIGRPL